MNSKPQTSLIAPFTFYVFDMYDHLAGGRDGSHRTPCSTVYRLDSRTLFNYSLALIHSNSSWLEIQCTVHVALPKRPIKWFQLVSQSRQQVVKAYCPNVYTVPCSKSNDMTPTGHLPFKLFGPTRLSVYISKEGTSIIFALGN